MRIFLTVSLILLIVNFYGQSNNLETNQTILKIEAKLKAEGLGRGMEQNKIKSKLRLDIPFWEKDSLVEYSYSIPDKIDNTLTAKVIMYNADIHRLANWIYFSLLDTKKKMDNTNIDKIISHIRSVSGFQFPIRGIVYEDLSNSKGRYSKTNNSFDGVQETYFFFDGISVSHKKIKVSTYNSSGIPQRVNDENVIVDMKEADIDSVFVYGRICNTQRQDYNKFLLFKKEKQIDLTGIKFLYKIREEYKKAMHNKKNNLITAWVLTNI